MAQTVHLFFQEFEALSTTPLSTLSRLWDVEVKSLWVRVQEPIEGQRWPQLRGARTPPPRHLPRPAARAAVSTGGGLVPPPAVPVAVTTPPAGLARPGWRRRVLRTACDLPRRRGGTHPGCSPPSGRAPNRGNGPRSLERDGGPPAADRPDAEAREPLTWALRPLRTLALSRAFWSSLAQRTRSHASTVLPPWRPSLTEVRACVSAGGSFRGPSERKRKGGEVGEPSLC